MDREPAVNSPKLDAKGRNHKHLHSSQCSLTRFEEGDRTRAWGNEDS
jgi:hypothetical protein